MYFGTIKRGNTSIGWKKTLSFDGALFFFVGKVIDNILYLWIYYSGEPNDVTKYSCVINACNKIGELFHYKGTVHSIDEEDNASQSVLMLGVSAATKDLFDEKVQLKIVVTIEKVGEVTGTTATHNKEKPRRLLRKICDWDKYHNFAFYLVTFEPIKVQTIIFRHLKCSHLSWFNSYNKKHFYYI